LRRPAKLVTVGDLMKRAGDVVAGTAGDTVGPAVTTLVTLAAAATGHPELALAAIPGGALAAAVTTGGLSLIYDTVQDKISRMQRFGKVAEEAAGKPLEDLLADVADSNQRIRDLLNRTVSGASQSSDGWKVDTLARAFVRGAQDPALVDEMLLLEELIRPLEAPHARLLAVLDRAEAGDFSPRAQPSSWNDTLARRDPGLVGRQVPLVARLVQLKLLEEDQPRNTLPLGKWVCDRLAELDAQLIDNEL